MKKLIMGIAAMLVLAGVAAAAFTAGQSTRVRDDAVAARVATAVQDRAERAQREQNDAVQRAVTRTRVADQADATKQAELARTAGYKTGQQDGHVNGTDDSEATTSDSSNSSEDQPRNTVTTQDGTWDRDSAAYQARCRELYNTWKSSEDVSGNYDSDGAPGDAIREYGDMLCDQS